MEGADVRMLQNGVATICMASIVYTATGPFLIENVQ